MHGELRTSCCVEFDDCVRLSEQQRPTPIISHGSSQRVHECPLAGRGTARRPGSQRDNSAHARGHEWLFGCVQHHCRRDWHGLAWQSGRCRGFCSPIAAFWLENKKNTGGETAAYCVAARVDWCRGGSKVVAEHVSYKPSGGYCCIESFVPGVVAVPLAENSNHLPIHLATNIQSLTHPAPKTAESKVFKYSSVVPMFCLAIRAAYQCFVFFRAGRGVLSRHRWRSSSFLRRRSTAVRSSCTPRDARNRWACWP